MNTTTKSSRPMRLSKVTALDFLARTANVLIAVIFDFDEKDKQSLGFTNIPPDGTGNKNMILYILKSPTGTWTVIEEHVSGTACIIASGITFDWVPGPEKKNKTNL